MRSSTTPKHRRGAPLGDQNACKHGHYASPKPHLAYSVAKPLDLDPHSEIDFIRHSIQLFQDLGEPQTYRHALDCQRAHSLTPLATPIMISTLHPPPEVGTLVKSGNPSAKSMPKSNPGHRRKLNLSDAYVSNRTLTTDA